MYQVSLLAVLVALFALAIGGETPESNDTFSPAAAGETSPDTLFVVNGSDEVLWGLYVSETLDESWGEDRLGLDILAPGAEIKIPLAAASRGCRYDVNAVFSSMDPAGHSYWGVDVCESNRLVVKRERPSIDTDVPVGTAFYISTDGKLITNHHVVDGCESIEVLHHAGQDSPLRSSVRVLASDAELDIAVLANTGGLIKPLETATFRKLPEVRLGESVVTYGFPEGDTMSRHGVVSTGVVSALSGVRQNPAGFSEDHDKYQTTAPVHPGNSGGPLLDGSGLVLGVVVGKRMDTNAVAYAIKAESVTAFLKAANVGFAVGMKAMELPVPEAVEAARRYVVPVFCQY